jgi:hypothetical protein
MRARILVRCESSFGPTSTPVENFNHLDCLVQLRYLLSCMSMLITKLLQSTLASAAPAENAFTCESTFLAS